MLQSLLIICILFGLISMILPRDRKGEWVGFLLLVTVLASVFTEISLRDWTLPEPNVPSVQEVSPAKEVLHWQIASQVCELTGQEPRSVSTDFHMEGDSFVFTRISVELSAGVREEVEHALRSSFGVGAVIVIGPQSDGASQDRRILPP